MDDSDQDFVDLCSKLLKRVRKKPGESRQPRKAESQPSSQASDGDKRRRNEKRERPKCAATQPVCTGPDCGGSGYDSGDTRSSGIPAAAAAAAAAGPRTEGGLSAKDKVLHRMQQFKRASPQKMVLTDKSQTTSHENDRVPPLHPVQKQDTPESLSSGLHAEPPDGDEALALLLQQQMDREASEVQTVNLEDGGLFFCQICQKDLSHMSPAGRTQHLNRCLDESEGNAPPPPPPPPPPPGVPDCPICGKRFKSQKSRSAHLKRCSSDMGVPPAVLLQALQRQAEETQNVSTANTLKETGGTKRKDPPKPSLPARKKPRKKTDALDEDTMVALALSSSLLDQEKESDRVMQTETAASHVSTAPSLKWRPDAGKGRGKRKKAGVPRPPPLLLVQDAEAALTRLQERVSALLLRSPPPSPPTPTYCPSSLPGWSGAAPLWQKSRLLDEDSTCLSAFYTPELKEFITPWESATTNAASSSTNNKPESSVPPASEGTPVRVTGSSILPSSSQTAPSFSASSTPGTGQLVGSQTFRDLLELAEEGMTLTQHCYPTTGLEKEKTAGQITDLHLSGFVPQESEEQAELCLSGFLPETSHTRTDKTHSDGRRTANQRGGDEERGSHRPVALSRLASDLSSMVNNPQLSDVQLQVDSGDVYFAHSFMVYARCPLLAEMVHESGFGVQEEGLPAAQRVLMSDVPGQAVFALLQFLYTAHCSIPASLRPHVLELASRFDLQELQQLCRCPPVDAVTQEDEEECLNQEENGNNQTDEAFMELLRSMWNEEDEDNEGTDTDGGGEGERGLEEDRREDELTAADREICEEKVNEEELDEIYEFAATQRKRVEKEESMEEEEEEEEEKLDDEDDGVEAITKLMETKRGSTDFSIRKPLNSFLRPDPSLDRSYSRLFSDSGGVYEGGDPSTLPSTSGHPKTHTSQSQKHLSPQKPSSNLSARLLLQSPTSLVDDVSPSPPPSASSLPVPGQSPNQMGVERTDGVDLNEPKEDLPLRPESQRPYYVPLSPDSPQRKKEPELIVLSDSSEEMEVVLSSRSPSPHFPSATEHLQSYTRIKPQSNVKPNEPTVGNKKSSSLEFSPDGPSASPVQSRPGSERDKSPVDFSPEVSWLVPSTPLHHGRSTSTSSTQTKTSMCRTRLFTKGVSSSSSVLSSPALPFNSRLQTSKSPAKVSAPVGQTEGSDSGLKQEEKVPCSSSSDLSFCPKRTSSSDVSKVPEVFAVPSCQSKHSHPSGSTTSKQDTPLHLQRQPYSSTPLHTELHLPPALLATSPFHSDPDTQSSTSQGRDEAPSDSPEKTELGSFHLSPLSNPSDPPSSSSHRSFQSSQRYSDPLRHSQQSKSSSHNNTGEDLMRRGIRDEEGESRCKNKGTDDEAKQEEAEGETEADEAAKSSFQHSFITEDDPPMAFNDSWGLDVCVDANPGCFSLRLEDSRGSNQQECSPRGRETASSPSSHKRQHSLSGHSLLNGRGSEATSSSSKAPSTQISSGVQGFTCPSITLSPPDPTPQTTPQLNNSLLDSKLWDSWEEEDKEEEDVALPLAQRVNSSAQLRTPASSHNKRRRTMVPITPMPHFSDMDTPELKNKLTRFGVRPLPKRQMILKLKEIHQYTHQLVSSDSEDEAPTGSRTAQMKLPPGSSVAAGNRPAFCAQSEKFKEPVAPAALSPLKRSREEEAEPLSASQGSNTSSAAASDESERSNPEICLSSDGDSDSDGGISTSQVATRLQDRLRAVRTFILSDSKLYTQILQYQPLVLSQLQQRLKAAGIRLGAAKLADYLDSQCVTFTTAKPGHMARSRTRAKKTGKGTKAVRAGKQMSQP